MMIRLVIYASLVFLFSCSKKEENAGWVDLTDSTSVLLNEKGDTLFYYFDKDDTVR